MNLLGIDFGLVHFGLALAEGKLVEPLGQLEVKGKTSRIVISHLLTICQRKQIQKIIIGLPQGKLLAKVKKFAQQLKEEIKLPVVFQDETLSTKLAVKEMVEIGKPKRKRQKEKHSFSACIILQDYLDCQTQRC